MMASQPNFSPNTLAMAKYKKQLESTTTNINMKSKRKRKVDDSLSPPRGPPPIHRHYVFPDDLNEIPSSASKDGRFIVPVKEVVKKTTRNSNKGRKVNDVRLLKNDANVFLLKESIKDAVKAIPTLKHSKGKRTSETFNKNENDFFVGEEKRKMEAVNKSAIRSRKGQRVEDGTFGRTEQVVFLLNESKKDTVKTIPTLKTAKGKITYETFIKNENDSFVTREPKQETVNKSLIQSRKRQKVKERTFSSSEQVVFLLKDPKSEPVRRSPIESGKALRVKDETFNKNERVSSVLKESQTEIVEESPSHTEQGVNDEKLDMNEQEQPKEKMKTHKSFLNKKNSKIPKIIRHHRDSSKLSAPTNSMEDINYADQKDINAGQKDTNHADQKASNLNCEAVCDKYPVLKNKDLVNKFLQVPITNNQKGRIRQVLRDIFKGTLPTLVPDLINNKIQSILKASENLNDSDLRKIRVLYNMLKKATEGTEGNVYLKPKNENNKKNSKKESKEELETLDTNRNTVSKKRYVVFVGNLPVNITKEAIVNHFSELQDYIKDVRIPPQTGKSAFAYLELLNESSYTFALSKHHSMLCNKRINVLYSTQKNSKISKAQAKSKSAKLQALIKKGQLLGSVPANRKRSARRAKAKQFLKQAEKNN